MKNKVERRTRWNEKRNGIGNNVENKQDGLKHRGVRNKVELGPR
jgi:hypothetical protein